MKKVSKILFNHSILILSVIAIILADLLFLFIGSHEDVLAVLLYTPVFFCSPCIVIFSGIYTFFFFRKDNFLTPLLPLSLIFLNKTEHSVISMMYLTWYTKSNLGLITFLICLIIRLMAIVLIRKYKEKLKEWTGEDKVTSDAVFWVRVLFKKLMKSIDPNCKF